MNQTIFSLNRIVNYFRQTIRLLKKVKQSRLFSQNLVYLDYIKRWICLDLIKFIQFKEKLFSLCVYLDLFIYVSFIYSFHCFSPFSFSLAQLSLCITFFSHNTCLLCCTFLFLRKNIKPEHNFSLLSCPRYKGIISGLLILLFKRL